MLPRRPCPHVAAPPSTHRHCAFLAGRLERSAPCRSPDVATLAGLPSGSLLACSIPRHSGRTKMSSSSSNGCWAPQPPRWTLDNSARGSGKSWFRHGVPPCARAGEPPLGSPSAMGAAASGVQPRAPQCVYPPCCRHRPAARGSRRLGSPVARGEATREEPSPDVRYGSSRLGSRNAEAAASALRSPTREEPSPDVRYGSCRLGSRNAEAAASDVRLREGSCFFGRPPDARPEALGLVVGIVYLVIFQQFHYAEDSINVCKGRQDGKLERVMIQRFGYLCTQFGGTEVDWEAATTSVQRSTLRPKNLGEKVKAQLLQRRASQRLRDQVEK
ncbi:hypothetical protein U9M48_005112, partial [Paspalum notatum var. saurae]